MSRRRWINVFLLSFVPLGVWLMVWLVRAVIRGGIEPGSPSLLFIIPTGLYVCLQVWLAVQVFRA